MFNDILSVARKELVTIAKEGSVFQAVVASKTMSVATINTEVARLQSAMVTLLEMFTEVRKALECVETNLKDSTLSSDIVADMVAARIPSNILMNSLKTALLTNKEYSNPLFTKGLIRAIRDPRTIKISPGSSSPVVIIDLNTTAGSVQDWMSAIQKVRLEMMNDSYNKSKANSGKGFQGGAWNITPVDLASRLWETMYYGPAREGRSAIRRRYNFKTKSYEERDVREMVVAQYWSTMRKRLESSGKPAPYWEIIDKGMAGMTGGGTAYPIPQPTNFVGNAIKKIKEEFNNIKKTRMNGFRKDKTKLLKIQAILDKEITAIRLQITTLQGMAASLARMLSRKAPVAASQVVAIAGERTIQQAFLERLEVYKDRPFDPNKVKQILESLYARDVGALSITREWRVEITARGGPRVRIRLKSIFDEFGIIP